MISNGYESWIAYCIVGEGALTVTMTVEVEVVYFEPLELMVSESDIRTY